jgi:selenocysteine lyase/cysteine desulfurase
MPRHQKKDMTNRRDFLKKVGLASAATAVSASTLWSKPFTEVNKKLISPLLLPPPADDFWSWVRTQYAVSSSLLNLNNGGVSPQSKFVQDAFFRYTEMANEAPTYYLWRILEDGKDVVRGKLADLLGASPEEVAVNRNATEALDTVIHGIPLNKGDEVVLSKYDYPRMVSAWKAREKREGIVLKWVDFDFPENDETAMAHKYTSLFTSKTKVVHITHLINWVGQITPVKLIATTAKKMGIKTLVDAAHSFAHIQFNVKDWDIDYLGTSLHKWLGSPFGTGMLYIRKEEIAGIKTFFSEDPIMEPGTIKKFEELGTRATTAELAIGEAVDFHLLIGSERKQERLYELKKYWTEKVKSHPKIKILTPESSQLSGALGLVCIEGHEAPDIDGYLLSQHRIHTVGIKYEKINGIRVTPNVYTSFDDLDRFCEALLKLANKN